MSIKDKSTTKRKVDSTSFTNSVGPNAKFRNPRTTLLLKIHNDLEERRTNNKINHYACLADCGNASGQCTHFAQTNIQMCHQNIPAVTLTN